MFYNAGTISMIKFVQLVSALPAGAITYPVNGTIWHNKEFRVCFQLPADPDQTNGYVEGTYKYNDVQLKVNNTTLTLSTNSTCFSCKQSNLTHQCKIVVYPNKLRYYNSKFIYIKF